MGDQESVEHVFKMGRFNAVMHFAAFIEAGESMQQPEKYFDNNSAKTLSLLRTVLKYQVPRFVFSSTAAVYGEPRTHSDHGRRSARSRPMPTANRS